MKAAIVAQAGQNAPVLGDFEAPVAGADEAIVQVDAAAISPLVRARAAGTHYSSRGQFPFVAGVDGVGRLDDGRRVAFALPRAPYGSMAERVPVPLAHIVPLPDGLDAVAAAALINPGMSSWAALTERARLARGETVLINGATGAAGSLAVQVARHLGAARVIATGRNQAALAALGADATILLDGDGDALETQFKAEFARGIDVVIDYLWGPSAERLLIAGAKAGPDAVPIRFVQVGSVGGGEINLPGAVLRSSAIELMGSGIGSIPLARLVASIGGVLGAAASDGFTLPARAMPLAEVAKAWALERERVVLTL
ncbi:zinc-binding alcohol dehydrogenase family protein [Sphingomonas sp. HITSZ_GF]|uniref:quinone oxidoreductase family protein n=1 Tax=Sphingomonas sp. HITSZ_GF TaxID=3037247 RepID=UPI00240D289D|nr:zinc-binding alcohol dehydrogenase family protein [Sphingomonas sp. HITSZ_GF]MDG2535966.1 zinc-binding alcohol dehydrogenase family protein [Sphingomonas sp. HITSZ_GF]